MLVVVSELCMATSVAGDEVVLDELVTSSQLVGGAKGIVCWPSGLSAELAPEESRERSRVALVGNDYGQKYRRLYKYMMQNNGEYSCCWVQKYISRTFCKNSNKIKGIESIIIYGNIGIEGYNKVMYVYHNTIIPSSN